MAMFRLFPLTLLPFVLVSCADSASTNQNPNQAAGVCLTNYLTVPASSDFATTEFCLAKFEMKNMGGVAEAQATGTPWTNLTRDEAKAACAAKGVRYSLPDNAHWMTVAREIESVPWNFGGAGDQYGVSRGVSNNGGATTVAANVDDNVSCHLAIHSGGAAAVCDLQTYDVSRRVNKLSNDELIWDFPGNASEWISDDFTENFGTKVWILNLADTRLKALFGPKQTYPAGPATPPGSNYVYNFGYLSSQTAPPYVVMRGGGSNYGRYAGIFTAYMVAPTLKSTDIGFRCMYSKD